MLNVITIVGSLRKESINKKLALALHKLNTECQWNFLGLDDLPFFNQDIELDLPAPISDMQTKIAQANGVLLVTPEYNRTIPGLLKNVIDWGTRPYGNNVWQNKPTAIIGASPSALGTVYAQTQLRSVMHAVGSNCMRLPEVYVSYCADDINSENIIINEEQRKILNNFVTEFIILIKNHTT